MTKEKQQVHDFFQIQNNLAKGWKIAVCLECGSAKFWAKEEPNQKRNKYDEVKGCSICHTAYEKRPTDREITSHHQIICWCSRI